MNKLLMCGLLLVGSTPALAGQPPEDAEIPRNVWGQPDLAGVWNFSSNVPMQRSQRFGDREFMTAEEIAELQARLAERDAASDQAVPSGPGNQGRCRAGPERRDGQDEHHEGDPRQPGLAFRPPGR